VEPIAVVGLGCVFPGAPDAATFWENLVAGRRSISDAPPDRLDPRFFEAGPPGGDRLATTRGGFVDGEALLFEPGRFGIMPVAVEDAEPDQMMALKTAAAAMDDAGGLDDVERERVGVVLGRGGYLMPGLVRLDQRVRTTVQLVEVLRSLLPDVDDDRLRAVGRRFAQQLGEPHPETSIGLVPNLVASRIANRFDLGGPAYTVDAACASSLIAVDSAMTELRAGRCDVVLAGGVHHCHDVTLWSVFSQLGALSPSGEIRPYSRFADGILVSEGTGLVVLERLSDAERLGHRVYATVLATGVASDGRDSSLMSPRVEGQVLALERAYRAAGLHPGTIDLVEGHGTATPAGDRAELETLCRVFGEGGAADAGAGVLGSVKSNIGHAMPAAGAAGLIKTVLAVHHGVLPPTLQAESPHPLLTRTRFRVLGEAEPWPERSRPRHAGVNAFGFGGIDAHAIVAEHRPIRAGARAGRAGPARSGAAAAPPGERPPVDGVLLQGRDAADLAAQLRALGPDGAAMPSRSQTAADAARLAIVGPNPKRLELAARLLSNGQPWRGRNDIWFEPAGLVRTGGRVAFVFPGVEPTFDARLEDLAGWLGGVDDRRVPDESPTLERQGWEIFEAGRLLHRGLGRLGVRPDDVAGHSLGEWTGAFAAELIPPDRSDDVLATLEPGSLEVPGVVFAALGCGADVARDAVAGLDGVVVSHDNCPHQSVICGPEPGIAEAAQRLAARKVLVQVLPFRSGFHTLHFEPYVEIVRRHWDRMPLQNPSVPLWSATTCRPYPRDPSDVRRLAVDHLLRPVRFRELIDAMYEDGVRVFVQMGVGTLPAFAEDTLKGRPHLAVAAAVPGRPGFAQLARAAAALWVEGVDVRLEELFGRAAPAAPTVRRSRTGGPTVRLSLGAPLVQLPPGDELGAGAAPAPPIPAVPGLSEALQIQAGDGGNELPLALRGELDALLAEAVDASRSIGAAVAGAPTRTLGRDGPGGPAGPAGGDSVVEATHDESAFAGEPVQEVPDVREALVVDVETFPWLLDHCFFRQPAGWDEPSDLFPVVPMTTMVDLLADAARRAAPGLVVTRIDNIRAFRWINGAPATRTTLTATRTGRFRVEAALAGYARATVHLADTAPPSGAPGAGPLRNPRPSPLAAARIYDDHWMFHGPGFQGLRSVTALGDDGADGVIEALPAPGACLDNAGQLHGWWLMATAHSNFLGLPQSIERIEFFEDQPSAGDAVDVTVRITEVSQRSTTADIELLRSGSVVTRITGWVNRRFDSDPPLWRMLREPDRHLVSSAFAPGLVAVEERWRDSASRELMARRYLDRSERGVYETLNPLDQRRWLLGRIAAKDAVRQELWAEGHGPLFPIEVPLADATPSSVRVTGGPAEGTRVAVVVESWTAAAGVGLPGLALVSTDASRGEGPDEARLTMDHALAAAAPEARGRISSVVLRSPFHDAARHDAAPHDADEPEDRSDEPEQRKEYVVAWPQPVT
jgi:acyl transferase domain-containing protein